MAENEQEIRRSKSESSERKRVRPKASEEMATDTEGFEVVTGGAPGTTSNNKGDESTQEAMVVRKADWQALLERTATLENDRLRENAKRRDLEDDIEQERSRITEVRQLAFNQNTAIASMLKVINSEGEHKDMVRIMVVKKRVTSMKQFYGAFLPFQTQMCQNPHAVQVTNAGPIWMVEADCPNSCQALRDQIYNLMQTAGLQTAVLRGKSNITEAKQRICAGAAAAVATTMGVNKGKGAPRRLETCWPDIKNQWRLLLDGRTIVAGTLNQTQMQLDVEIAEDVAGDQNKAREIAHCIREWERTDRIGYLLFPQITVSPSLRDCDYGRAPKNMGKGGYGNGQQQQGGNGNGQQGGKGNGQQLQTGIGQYGSGQLQQSGNGLGPSAPDPWSSYGKAASSSSGQLQANNLAEQQRLAEEQRREEQGGARAAWLAPIARKEEVSEANPQQQPQSGAEQSYASRTSTGPAPLPG
jgi:hypothetical protein